MRVQREERREMEEGGGEAKFSHIPSRLSCCRGKLGSCGGNVKGPPACSWFYTFIFASLFTYIQQWQLHCMRLVRNEESKILINIRFL